MQPKPKPFYTPDEYLAQERVAEAKSEYYRGDILAFAGASLNHNVIAVNTLSELNFALKKKNCATFGSDMRIWVADEKLFTYPDISVVCGEAEFYDHHRDSLINPLVIAEVLSKSTAKYDREGKFRLYRSLSSFKEYVLVDQYSVYVEQFWKTAADEWQLKVFDHKDDVLVFKFIDVNIAIKDIYHKVKFEEET
jgi:Uma2 family endonuclease